MWLSTTQLAKREGVSTQTIRRYIDSGRYEQIKRTPTGHYRIFINVDTRIICYARVSSRKQHSSLEAQINLLKQRYPYAEVIADTASAFNFKRSGIEAILESSLSGTPVKLVATSQDRIARSGFELIRKLIELSGGEIELLDDTVEASDFNCAELISFITSFCNSYYGKRSAARKRNSS